MLTPLYHLTEECVIQGESIIHYHQIECEDLENAAWTGARKAKHRQDTATRMRTGVF